MWTAFVLAGGGAKGCFQAGVISKLYEQGIRPDFIAGTSAGALNAAGLSHRGPEYVEEIWRNIYSIDDVFKRSWKPWVSWRTQDPLYDIVSEAMTAQARIPYCVMISDLMSQCAFEMHSHAANPIHIVASASIPGVVPPVYGYLADGGLLHNCPLKPAIKVCPDPQGKIYIVSCSRIYARPKDYICDSIVETFVKSFDAVVSNNVKEDYEYALELNNTPGKRHFDITLIEPPEHFDVTTLDFNPIKIRAGIEMGRAAVQGEINAKAI